MGVGSLNTKAMLSMCFCPVFPLSFFLFVFFFCYNVIHLRWMTVVVHLRSPPGKSHLIRFSPRYNDPFANILKIPIAVVHRRSSFCPSYIRIPEPSLVRCLESHRIPCPSHSSQSPLSAALPHVLIGLVAPVAPMAPMGPANNNKPNLRGDNISASREDDGDILENSTINTNIATTKTVKLSCKDSEEPRGRCG